MCCSGLPVHLLINRIHGQDIRGTMSVADILSYAAWDAYILLQCLRCLQSNTHSVHHRCVGIESITHHYVHYHTYIHLQPLPTCSLCPKYLQRSLGY